MPTQETVLRVFVSSPSDLLDERQLLEGVINELNQTWRRDLGISMQLLKWETDVVPAISTDPQSAINEQIGDDYDIFIGIVWKRFGTPTPRASSGTIEEFERACARWQADPDSVRIMFYFKDAPVPLSEMNAEDLKRIEDFQDQLKREGILLSKFKDIEDFGRLARMHLSKQAQEFKRRIPTDAGMGTIQSSDCTADLAGISVSERLEEEEGEGFLDSIEIADESFRTLTEVTQRMMDATIQVGERMAQRGAEIQQAYTSPGTIDVTAAKRASNRAAADLEQFATLLEAELLVYSDTYARGMDAYVRAAELLTDFTIEDDNDLLNALATVRQLRLGLKETHEAIIDFRTSVAQIPRATTALTRAKKRTIATLDNLVEQMSSGSDMAGEVEQVFERLVQDLGLSRDRPEDS